MVVSATAPRSVTILGSTGSVGGNTVDLISRDPDAYVVEALVARRNVAALAEQARQLRAKVAVVADEAHYADLKAALAGTGIEVAAGAQAVVEAAERPADWVMAAIVGAAGMEPTLAAARRGAIVAFANKEVLVCAGSLMMAEVERHGATLLPVDSEHSAIFQVLENDRAPPSAASSSRRPAGRSGPRPGRRWRAPRSRKRCAIPPGTWAPRFPSTAPP